MKKAVFFSYFFFLLLFPLLASNPAEFDLGIGRYNMSLTPKVLEDGTQLDVSLGLFFTDAMKMAGDVRLRYTNGASNDTVWGIEDSLLTRDRQILELFVLPLNYHFLRKGGLSLSAGAGFYYEFNKLNENGYFNDSALYDPPSADNYNAYTNNYSGKSFGPLVDTGISFRSGFFYGSLSFGIVPVFSLERNQTWKLSPLMTANPSYTVTGKSTCGPYCYLNLSTALDFNYFALFASFLYDYSNLNYTAAGFNDDTGDWADINESFKYKSFAFEISLLINTGEGGFKPQIGYGRTYDDVSGSGNYMIFGIKKMFF